MPEPVTLEELKQAAGINYDDRDALFTTYITAARAMVENESDMIVVARSITEEFAAFPAYFELSRQPVSAVTGLTYTDADGVTQSFADYTLTQGRVYPDTAWPTLGTNGVVSITYTAGAACPDQLKQAILCQAVYMIDNPEGGFNPGAKSLCSDYFRVRI